MLPVPDNSVDVVLSNCVINLSPDKPKVWREIYRVLKSGGKVSVSDLALLKPLPDNVRDMAAALVGCVAGAVLVEETKALLEKSGVHIHSADAQARLCAEHAGLERSSVQTNSGNTSARRGNGRLCGQPVHRSPQITKRQNYRSAPCGSGSRGFFVGKCMNPEYIIKLGHALRESNEKTSVRLIPSCSP